MKKIYTFTLNKAEEVDQKVENVNEVGEKTITITKVKKEVPHKFCFVKPGKNLRDESELFYGVEYGKAIQKGMIPAALLQKRFENDNGILSEKTKDNIKITVEQIVNNDKIIKELQGKTDKMDEDASKIKELETLNKVLTKDLQNVQSRQSSLYDNTPEVYARNKTGVWFMLFLSYKEDGDKLTPLFPGATYEEKVNVFDDIEDQNDTFLNSVISKFLSIASVYYGTGLSSQKEIDDFLLRLNDPE